LASLAVNVSCDSFFLEIYKLDDGWVANACVVAGEAECPSFGVHLKDRYIIGSLIAAIQILARRFDVEASGIVAASPFFANVR
jgi:hypothetical protein